MAKKVFALAAHPDDIEFMMAGTMLELQKCGFELHYMTIANGSMGSAVDDIETIIKKRKQESIAACKLIGAIYHPSICNDIEVFYNKDLIQKLSAVVREIEPDIMLLPPTDMDYMEDHINSARLAVTAAFCRAMPNHITHPPVPPMEKDITLYHALPYGLKDFYNRDIIPGAFVDVSESIELKAEMLALHKSQKEWLDSSQGLNSYTQTLKDMSAKVGELSGKFTFAEGWTKRSHLGFCSEDANPLADVLGTKFLINPKF